MMTMKKLIVRYAGVRRNFRIDLVSNSDITAHEFERWSARPPPAAATSAPRLGSPLPRLHGTRGFLSAPSRWVVSPVPCMQCELC